MNPDLTISENLEKGLIDSERAEDWEKRAKWFGLTNPTIQQIKDAEFASYLEDVDDGWY